MTRGDRPPGPAAAAASYETAAAGYDGFMGRCSRLFAPALVEAAGVRPGQRVLDVAAGTGVAALAALARVGPAGCVVAVDLSVPMLRVAAARGGAAGLRVAAMDALALACREQGFDVVLCQLGLMFFPDLGGGLGELRRVLRPGGALGALVWSVPERMPMVAPLGRALEERRPAQRDTLRVPFRLARPDDLHAALGRAGFRDVAIEPATRTVTFESVDAYFAAFEAGGGAVRPVYLQLSPGERQEVVAAVREALLPYTGEDGVLRLPVEGLLAVARA